MGKTNFERDNKTLGCVAVVGIVGCTTSKWRVFHIERVFVPSPTPLMIFPTCVSNVAAKEEPILFIASATSPLEGFCKRFLIYYWWCMCSILVVVISMLGPSSSSFTTLGDNQVNHSNCEVQLWPEICHMHAFHSMMWPWLHFQIRQFRLIRGDSRGDVDPFFQGQQSNIWKWQCHA